MCVVKHPKKASPKQLGSDSHIQIPLRTVAELFDSSGPSFEWFSYRMGKVFVH